MECGGHVRAVGPLGGFGEENQLRWSIFSVLHNSNHTSDLLAEQPEKEFVLCYKAVSYHPVDIT